MIAAGTVSKWYQGTDTLVREVSRTVNGPMLAELAVEAGVKNTKCVDVFRAGGKLVGRIGAGISESTGEESGGAISMRELVCNRCGFLSSPPRLSLRTHCPTGERIIKDY